MEKLSEAKAENLKALNKFALIFSCAVAIFVIFVKILTASSTKQISESKPEQKKIGDFVEVGNFVYKVKNIAFTKHLGNEFIHETADGIYLIVWLSIKNISKESRIVDNALFKLTDNSGTEYEPSLNGITALEMSGGKTLFLKQCQPNITTSGFIVFEVPEKGIYNLLLSGGFFDSKKASVRLSQ